MKPGQSIELFNPIIRKWFSENIGIPSPPQEEGWPAIARGENVLIAAPTGAGKTLSAFLVCINRLFEQGIKGELPDTVQVLYISPLKALNNDIYRNLEVPLAGIEEQCRAAGIAFPKITKAVRTGDTTPHERQRMLKKPPHILITTPESLYLLLTSKNSQKILKGIRYVIIDEIHALLGNKRGVHLMLSIERLRELIGTDPVRIGLSATVNPMEEAARFLGGCELRSGRWDYRPVTIVQPRMKKEVDLRVIMPVRDFRVLEDGTVWPGIYEEIYKHILTHKSTLVFVNNRATAEKIAANLNVMALKTIAKTHHGCISKESRLEVEKELKAGKLPCLVATSSLELGIDVGEIELIIQVASPKSSARGLQRLGRAGHRLNAVSKGRIIPRTRGDLLDSVIISREMLNKHIEEEMVPKNSLDILSQHLVSMACTREWTLDEILVVVKSAYSFNTIKTDEVEKVISMLAGEYEHREDIPASPRVFWDSINKTLSGNGYSRMLAVGSGGTIPDRGYYGVYLGDRTTRIGELDEEFVFEARINDRFILGTSAWRIERIERDRVIVSPSGYSGARTPFWKGDGLGRPYSLGLRYGAFLRELSVRAGDEGFGPWLTANAPVDEDGVRNLEEYMVEQKTALGAQSSDRLIVVEYFGDETGDTRIVIHSHFGGRINSALGILLEHGLTKALNCQLELIHSDDGILIHLVGISGHPKNIFSLISSERVEEVLIETLPYTNLFAMTFRYNAGRALMMGAARHGRRNPLWIQRLRGLESLKNAQKYTDHPLVIETFRECLEHIMDVPNLIKVLKDIESGYIDILERIVKKPSPFASELLFGFAGKAMYEEQPARPGNGDSKVISGTEALNLNYRLKGQGLISEEAFKRAAAELNPLKKRSVRSANELHSTLLTVGDICTADLFSIMGDREQVQQIIEWLYELKGAGRALYLGDMYSGLDLWIAAEEGTLYSGALSGLEPGPVEYSPFEGQKRIIRRYARYAGSFGKEDIAGRYGIDDDTAAAVLKSLEEDGLLLCGRFREGAARDEWVHRVVLERMRHTTMQMDREDVPVRDSCTFAAFMADWQGIGRDWASPEDRLMEVMLQLKGMYLPADWWEEVVFPARIPRYKKSMLDMLCASGRVIWRIRAEGTRMLLAFFTMEDLEPDRVRSGGLVPDGSDLNEEEIKVHDVLKKRGACFLHTLGAESGIGGGSLISVLEGLLWKGLVVNDSFEAVRYFLNETSDNVKRKAQKRAIAYKMEMGRWEAAIPVRRPGAGQALGILFGRYGLLAKEVLSTEDMGISWGEAYELLKQWEYVGKAGRGYFIKGLSGAQYITPGIKGRLREPPDALSVMCGCDPAQIYGRICPFPEGVNWACLPSTVVVQKSGVPILIAERWGERLLFLAEDEVSAEGLKAFVEAFHTGRIWPGRRKITVKSIDGRPSPPASGAGQLEGLGFEHEMQDMVLWRRIRH